MKTVMKFNFVGIEVLAADPWSYYMAVFGHNKKTPEAKYHREFTKEEKDFFWENSREDAVKSDLYKEIAASAGCAEYIKEHSTAETEIAKKNLQTMQANLKRQGGLVENYIVNTLGLGFLEMPPVDVVAVKHGGYYSKIDKVIRWGHPNSETDPCYDGRYLFHEWFHAVEDFYKLPSPDVTHAALNLADKYLYEKVLGGQKDYGDGHSEYQELHDKIRPYFNDFVEGKGTAKNFIEFREQMIDLVENPKK